MKKVTPAPQKKAPTKNAQVSKPGKPIVTPAPPERGLQNVSTNTGTKALAVKPAINDLLLQDAGAGTEVMGREDFAIPRLKILEALSGECIKRDEAYIEGAEPGHILDSVSNSIYDGGEGIEVILVSYRRAYIEFWPRNSKQGKGFVADHGSDASVLDKCTKDEQGRQITPKGTEIVVTAEYFAFMIKDDGGVDRVLISMSKSRLQTARRINTMANQLRIPHPSGTGVFNPAMFYRTYVLTTVPKSNDDGNWFVWDVKVGRNTLDLPGGEDLYLEARSFREAIAKGEVKVQAPDDGHQGDGAGGGSVDDSAPM